MKTSHIVLIILSVCALAAILYLLTAGNKATKSSITNNRTLLGSNVSEGYNDLTQEQVLLEFEILELEEKVQSSDAYKIMSNDDFQINIPGYTKEQVLNALKYTTMFMKAQENGSQTLITQIQTDYIEHLKNYTDLVTNPLFYILYYNLIQFNHIAINGDSETKLKTIEIDCGEEELCTEDNISSIKMIVVGNTIETQDNKPQYKFENMTDFKDFEDQNPIKANAEYNMCDDSIKQTCSSGEKSVLLAQVTVTLKQFNEYLNSAYSDFKKELVG